MLLGGGEEQRGEWLSEPTLTFALVPLLLAVGTSLRLDPFIQFLLWAVVLLVFIYLFNKVTSLFKKDFIY